MGENSRSIRTMHFLRYGWQFRVTKLLFYCPLCISSSRFLNYFIYTLVNSFFRPGTRNTGGCRKSNIFRTGGIMAPSLDRFLAPSSGYLISSLNILGPCSIQTLPWTPSGLSISLAARAVTSLCTHTYTSTCFQNVRRRSCEKASGQQASCKFLSKRGTNIYHIIWVEIFIK
jgi:hypothetical protein